MKQAAQKANKTPKVLSPALKALKQQVEKAAQSLEKAYTDLDKKLLVYKKSTQKEPAKNEFFQIWTALKIARLTVKIKESEYKLAKSDYKFAKKVEKKAGQKASVENTESEGQPSKQRNMKSKEKRKN